MSAQPTLVTLELTPRSRTDVIDVAAEVEERAPETLRRYKRAIYCSYHTTAGFLEQALLTRLRHSPDGLHSMIRAFQHVFPADAPYRHDQLDERTELSDEQRRTEPRNADSHLTFIGSGLRNCATYVNRPDTVLPVYLVELDGTYEGRPRRRRTTVLAYNEERRVLRRTLQLPVSRHPVDSINLADPRVGLIEQINEWLQQEGVGQGRVDVTLAAQERNAGLTVNEYETLLMQHDLADVLRNPLRFMREKGRNMLIDPRSVPAKTINYAKYDLVHLFNGLMESLGIDESGLERLLARFIAVPAERFLRMKRSVSLLVADPEGRGRTEIVRGTYQSPILVQWSLAEHQVREVTVTVTDFR